MITMITPSVPTGQLLIDKAAFRKYNVEMYRVLFEDGTISDLVNKSRAKDLMRDDNQDTAETSPSETGLGKVLSVKETPPSADVRRAGKRARRTPVRH